MLSTLLPSLRTHRLWRSLGLGWAAVNLDDDDDDVDDSALSVLAVLILLRQAPHYLIVDCHYCHL